LRDQKAIDSVDAQIIKILLKESRTSFTKIAKDCKISVNAVRKRYNRLLRIGIINGEIMQLNPQTFGYKCIVNLLVITNISNENIVIKFLKSKPYVCEVFKNLFETTNLGCIIGLHEVQELSGIIQDIETNPLIKSVNTIFWNKTTNLDYPENLLLLPSIDKIDIKHERKPNITIIKKIEMDETDRQIAKILSQNSRTTFTKIAKELKISIKNVIQRYSKLRGTVLASSTITIDLEKLGYNAIVNLRLKITNRSKSSEVLSKILEMPNVIVILEYVGGDVDLFPIIALRDYNELFRLKEQLTAIQGIEQVSMFLNEPYHAWPLNLFASLL
jgi:Lrp/AsnC family transcriptional regulator, regulator for asnA, asnC and gidA